MKIVRTLVIFGGLNLSGYYGITYSVNPALAQIIPDNTLGDNQTLVKPNVEVKGLPADLIEGGATRGDNLFHSFSEFNVGDLQRVYFANPAGINNILSRVTGSNISKIFGTLGVDGAANLFLLNPNGIVFGPNASLDVAGSFVGSTANSIVFGNGTEFSATNPEEPPLLSINITPGLQYGQNPPQPIVNAGNLAVGPGENLTLVGGSVISTGDILTAGGEINLVAVPSETLVQLGQAGEILTLSTSSPSIGSNSGSVTEFFSSLSDDTGITVTPDGQVTLTESGTIVPLEPGTVIISGELNAANLAPGQTGGKVTVLGDQVGLFQAQLNGGSNVTITAGTTGNQEGNITADGFEINKTTEGEVTLTLEAANDISLKNVDINANSGLLNLVLEADSDNSGSGDVELINGGINTGGGAVTITAAGAIALESLDINSDTESQDNAGDITITAGSLLLENDSDIESNTKGNSSGDAGKITITADSVVFREQSGLGTNTQDQSTGNAGQITITASSVLFEGQGAGLGSDTKNHSSGDAGIITINADSVVFREQSGIGTNTTDHSTGDAGEITITAGSVLFENQTGLGSDTKDNSSGNGGLIIINADSLVFRNQSGLGTNTTDDSTGDAGEITITGSSVLFENQSGLGSNTQDNSSGDAGIIIINADSVEFKNESGISTNTTDNSTGNAGTITINADSISLENNSNISSQTVSGDGGNITLTLQDLLLLRDGSLISTSAGTEDQPGNGGNITITADFILAVLEENSDITANAFEGNGGNITLTGRGIFGFNFPDQPTNLSDITASSELGVDGNIEIQILDFNPSQGLVKLPTTVVDASTRILPSCAENVKVGSNNSTGDEFIVTGRGGLPPSPLDPITSQRVIADWVTLDNSATENYQSQRHSPAAREESARKRPRRRIVEAQGWLIGPDGTVILTAFPTTPETWANSSRKSPSCEDLRRITNGS